MREELQRAATTHGLRLLQSALLVRVLFQLVNLFRQCQSDVWVFDGIAEEVGFCSLHVSGFQAESAEQVVDVHVFLLERLALDFAEVGRRQDARSRAADCESVHDLSSGSSDICRVRGFQYPQGYRQEQTDRRCQQGVEPQAAWGRVGCCSL